MSWTVGGCPTSFGDLDRVTVTGLVMAELQRAVSERSIHAVTSTDYPAVALDHYDRKDVKATTPDPIGGGSPQVQTFVGVRNWIEAQWGYFGNPDDTPYMRPYFKSYQTAGGAWDLAAFLTAKLGYDAWKTSTTDILSNKAPIQGREIEEARKILELLQWAPLWLDWLQYPGVGDTSRFGTYVVKAYNDGGLPAQSFGGVPTSGKATVWNDLLGRVDNTLQNGILDLGGFKSFQAGSGLEVRRFDPWPGPFRWLMFQTQASDGIPTWNQRIKIEFLPSKTGDLKLTLHGKNYQQWNAITWNALFYLTTTAPPTDWYNWGAWGAPLHTIAFTEADHNEYHIEGLDYSAGLVTHYMMVTAWEPTPHNYPEWQYANACTSEYPDAQIRSYMAATQGIWEDGNYTYGTP